MNMALVGAGRRKCPRKKYRSRICQMEGEGTLVPCANFLQGRVPDGLDADS